MKPSTIRNICRIPQHGRTFYYFEAKTIRDSWEGIAYAHSRNWRVIGAWEKDHTWTTYQCEPIKVNRVGLNELQPVTDKKD